MLRKILLTIALLAIVLVAVAGILFATNVSDPLDDMVVRFNALPVPRDFVFVSESVRGIGFSSPATISRTYHASWPGLCDTLRSLRDRAGRPMEIAQPGRELEGRLCDFMGTYRVGWRGRLKNFRQYELRLRGVEPGLFEKARAQLPNLTQLNRIDSTLTLEQLKELYPERFFPPNRARVDLELIAFRR